MAIQATNNTAGTITYSTLNVSLGAGATATIPFSLVVPASIDPNVLADIKADNLYLSDGLTQYHGYAAIQLLLSTAAAMPLSVGSTYFYYSAPINIRQSAGTAANATVWAMRNAAASTKTIYIERIELMMGFDAGTPLGRSLQRYDLIRFATATPTGGTAVAVAQMDSSALATQVTDVRFLDTGLTTTGATLGATFATIGCPASDGATASYSRCGIAIKLGPGEGFAIRLNVAAVAGQSLTGDIVWSER